jgi:hypothetical protein
VHAHCCDYKNHHTPSDYYLSINFLATTKNECTIEEKHFIVTAVGTEMLYQMRMSRGTVITMIWLYLVMGCTFAVRKQCFANIDFGTCIHMPEQN